MYPRNSTMMKNKRVPFFAAAICMVPLVPAASAQWVLKEVPEQSLAMEKDGKLVWQFNFGNDDPKPFFHPLRTVDGHDLTWLRPDDHPWHLGLWFSWKSINGKNYWESDRTTGKSEGVTEVTEAKVTKNADVSADVKLRLSYHLPDGPEVLGEVRTVRISPPDADGAYRIDFQHVFTAASGKVVLDRTPPQSAGGPRWGGYAGLSLRSAATMTDRVALDSNGFTNTGPIMGSGKTANWMDLSGTVDEASKGKAGVTLIEHPASFRHPTPWYIYFDGKFGAIKSAPIYAEPITLEAGKSFTLRYRVLIHPGMGETATLATEYQEFAKEK
jgi:hypothetical protein